MICCSETHGISLINTEYQKKRKEKVTLDTKEFAWCTFPALRLDTAMAVRGMRLLPAGCVNEELMAIREAGQGTSKGC